MGKKKILITGKNSYIGTSFMQWVSQWPDQYEVEAISVRGEEWRNHDFSKYDSVLHVAGIAHVSANPKLKDLYYKVNRDLAVEVAQKAKRDGAKQFIFMSSIIIYGPDGMVGEKKVITEDTIPNPKDFYGKSKLEADLAIQKLNTDDFKTVVVRTPMVYGPKCRGNFPKLVKSAKYLPIFPDIVNERSMIFINNLSEFLRIVIENLQSGLFFPQNKDYVATKDIINIAAKHIGKTVIFIRLFNPIIRLISKKIIFLNKIFGNKVYSKNMSFELEYNVVDFNESIKKSL